jgi:hypothetical protein
VADREPALEVGVDRADAVLCAAGRARLPGDNRDLGTVTEAGERLLAGVVRQCHARRSVARAGNINSTTDGEDQTADTDWHGPWTPTEPHRNLLVAA